MTRFWMVQHVMWWVTLILASVLDWPWWRFTIAAVMLVISGVLFGRFCQHDDRRARPLTFKIGDAFTEPVR